MEWLTSNGEIYHRSCVYWTEAIEAGKCERCGEAIPEPMLRLAHSQRAERARIARERDKQRSLKALSQRFAQIEAKTNATLRKPSEPSR